MTCRIAINGYGRIGQSVLRALYEGQYRERLQIVAINELSDIETISYLTRYDTTHGRFPYPVDILTNSKDVQKLQILNDDISVYRSESLAELPWKAENIDLVMECTGVYGKRSDAEKHLASGAQKVLFSQPADLSVDKTIVYGVNHTLLSAQDRIVSNASCTTNAIIPVIKALHEAFHIQQGTLTTIHSAMNDQPTIDAYHHQDLRRTRSAMQNIVPVNTALAVGIERILPEMAGRLSAVAIRVPTINVSAIDLTVYVKASTTVSQVNEVLKAASQSEFCGVLAYTEEPLASSDFNHDVHSGIVDGSQTCVSGQRLIKVLTWFDNEWAFANRMLDVANHWSSL
ncbi:MAG: D-erythrose 4-phosphate dehydrogenase [Pseudohongiellaceae bacterium]|jgi:glyceraldehyde 3-phosphate dehydrogenase/D-erythrose 4-phosphate dehydrogenase